MSTIGARIRERRVERQWTQLDLARALGTDSMSVSRWERGASVPRPETLVKIADALGVSVRWLITGSDAGPESDATEAGATGTDG